MTEAGITVAGLLEYPHLALRVLAGRAGENRPLTWAHVVEVADPSPWLEGGELVMTTGLTLSPEPAEQVAYLRRVAAAGAAALLTVPDSTPPLTPELLRCADELGLPLLATVLKQPFHTISKVVYAANSGGEARRTLRHLAIYGVLRTAAAVDESPQEVLRRLAASTGMRLAVVGEDGRPRFEPGPPHDRWGEVRAALDALGPHARDGRFARLANGAGGPAGYVLQLDAAGASQTFLVAEGQDDTVPELVAVHHIATVAASQVLRQRADRSLRQRLGSELLREILDEEITEQAARARLEALGIPPQPVAAVAVQPRPEERYRLADTLHDVLLDRDIRAIVGVRREHVIVLATVATSTSALADGIAAAVGEPADANVPVGVGTPGPVRDAAASLRRALIALASAASTGGEVTHFDRLEAPLTWVGLDPERLTSLIEVTVAPLIEYDAKHRSELLETLRVYLACNRSPSAAADALHVHRNTLAYRLTRIEALTGRSMSSVDDQVELWLGARAYQLESSRVTAV